MNDGVRRAVLLALVVAVLVGVGVASSGGTSGPARPGAVVPAAALAMTPAGAESSAWFCPGSTGVGGPAAGDLVLTNPTPRPVTATVTTVSTTGSTSAPVSVAAGTETALAPASLTGALASTVVVDGGGTAVSQALSGPSGFTDAGCAARTAPAWYFADASTAGGDTVSLALLNPTATVAVVDVSFVTARGAVAPPAYQGIDVAGGSLVVENVGDHIEDTAHLATEVRALSGQIVAGELEVPAAAGGGPSVVLGTPSPARLWTFPDNASTAGGQTVFHVFNPSARPAAVAVHFGLVQGASEPFVLRVAPGSTASVVAQRETRIPSGSTFSATFSSGMTGASTTAVGSTGPGIVVERQVAAPTAMATPTATGGATGSTAGVVGGARRWLVPSVSPPATAVTTLAVVDVGAEPVGVRLVEVTAGGLRPVSGFGTRRVGPDHPLIVTPAAGSPIGAAPVEVVASGPVAVEADAGPVISPGAVVVPAIAVG